MKKNILSQFIPLLTAIISLIIITLIWEKIKLPFDNPKEIVGFYSLNNHHYINDTLRFILFIFFPLFSYLTTYFFLDKDSLKKIKVFFLKKIKTHSSRNNDEIFFYLLIFFLLTFFHLFLIEFPDQELDVFHEGQLLSGAMNFDITKNLWKNSYSNTGIFYDVINTKLAWMLTGVKSIGSMRFYNIMLNSITSLFLILLVFEISKNLHFKIDYKILFFIILSFISLVFSNKELISYRSLPIIFFLILSLKLIVKKKNYKFSSLLLGLLSVFSLLWSLDKGIYLNAAIFPLLLLLYLKKKFSTIKFILIGISLGWIILFLLIPKSEFYEFLNNSITILQNHELLNGIIHPQPFSDSKNSSRATKILLLFIINGIILIEIIFSKKFEKINALILYFFLFFILSIFSYKTGLSRSDGGHIEKGGALNYFLFLTLVIYLMFFFIENYFKNFNIYSIFNKKIYALFLILSILFVNQDLNIKKLSNFLNFKSRLINFVNFKDNFFMNQKYINLVNKINTINKNENCFQVFTYEPTITYLLKQKSCTKFYNIWSTGSKSNQLRFVEELKKTNPKYILYNSPFDSWNFSPEERFVYVDKYIKENYKLDHNYLKWNILVIKTN